MSKELTADVQKFRKKPIVVDAIRFTYPPTKELKDFVGDSLGRSSKARHPDAKGEIEVRTLEDGENDRVRHIATEGDWIIRGISGEFYPCKPDIFRATYEPT